MTAFMSPLTVRQAATRLRQLDQRQPERNGPDLFIAASGGYGKNYQDQLLADVRALHAHILSERPGWQPPDVACARRPPSRRWKRVSSACHQPR